MEPTSGLDAFGSRAGYRRPSPTGSKASRKALREIDVLLDGIVREAVK